MTQGNCSSAYALAMASAISDRLCLVSGKRNQLAPQYVVSCDADINEGCTKGYAQRAFDFFSKGKLINETCMPYAFGKFVNCSEKCPDSLTEPGKLSKVCGVEAQEQIKREIVLNGPVVSQIEIRSDFLTYKEGIYNSDNAQYVYAGGHVVKIIGWGEENGRKYWIIENTWGSDWGEDGFAKIEIIGKDDLQLSRIAIAPVIEGKKEEKKVKVEEVTTEEVIAQTETAKPAETEKSAKPAHK